jgi:hypothetical protein
MYLDADIRNNYWGGCFVMSDRVTRRNKFRKELAELRETVIADLESRGYPVRGKTPAQIKQILKRRPSKQRPNTETAAGQATS